MCKVHRSSICLLPVYLNISIHYDYTELTIYNIPIDKAWFILPYIIPRYVGNFIH